MRARSSLLLALAVLVTLVLLVGLFSGVSQARESPLSSSPMPPIDAALLDILLAEGSTDFVVILGEQADLSDATSLEDWNQRGRFVYNTLRDLAQRSQAPVLAYLDQRGFTSRSFISSNSVYVEGGDLAAAQAIARLPGVARIRLPEVATIQPTLLLSQPPVESYNWNLDVLDPLAGSFGMQAAQVWQQYGVTGENITIGSIDTGVYFQHVALDRQYRGNLTGNIGGPYDHDYNWYQPNFKPCGTGTFPCDADSHGSGTVGIMVGETPDQSEQIGVAPGAQWMACQGCDDPPYCTEAALNGCADWMLAPCPIGADPGDPSCNPDLRPHIVNNSWGGSGCNTWYQPFVQAWVAAGIFPAFAAGNAGGCGTLASPGDLPESFGTAAHYTSGLNAFAGGPSCFYPTPTCEPDAHDIDPHVNAPTGGRTSGDCQSCYYSLGGTSGASPHTAGTVALMWSANPGMIGQIDATFTALEQSANRELPAPNCGKPACAGANDYPNYDFGWGYLDALAGVEMVGVAGLGALQGTVTEGSLPEGPGDPLPGVTIEARETDGLLAFSRDTGPTGVYSMTLAQGTYTVTADGPLHGPAVVSDVTVITDSVTTLDFQLLPKGELVGYVTDAKTGSPLEATVGTPNTDPVATNPDTGYYSVYLGHGNHDVFVQAPNYASQSINVQIVSGQQSQQDFALIKALDVAPQPIQASVELFDSLGVTTVLTNNTTVAFDFALTHEAARAGGEGAILLVHGETLDENPDAFEVALSNLNFDYLLIDKNTFFATPIPDLLNFAAVIYTGTPSAGAGHDHIMAYLDAGGRFLLSDGSFTLYHQDSRLHEVYLQAYYDGLWEWAGVQNGLDIMAGLQPDISSAIVVYDSFAGPAGVGIFQSQGSNYTGIRTERAGYRAIYLSFDLNRIGDRVPGDALETDVVYRAMLWLLGYSVEAQWFDSIPNGGTAPPLSSSSFTSQFTATPANGIDQPGDFYATLRVAPAATGEIYPRIDIPVHLSVLPTPTMGKVAGTITNDRPGGPVEADVQMNSGGGGEWHVLSDWWSGEYGYWLEAGDYILTVAVNGYYTETAPVTVQAGVTTTRNFSLTLAAPEIAVSPAVMDESLALGEAVTRSLQIANSGPEPLFFEVEERNRGMTPLTEAIPEGKNVDVDGAQILFDAVHGGNPLYYEDLFTDLELLGATVDVVSNGRITSTVLAGYDILFIGDFLDIPYHYSELDAIDAFVREGGGLFVSYECCDDTTAPVLTEMYDIIYIGRGGTEGVSHNVYPHPTTENVGAVFSPSPQYLMTATVTSTAEIILYDAGGEPAAAVNEVGNGKVFVMPDQQLWDGVYDQDDNTQFGRNIFTWLYGGVSWLATDIVSATVLPGETITVTVTLDGAVVDEPAIYYGDLILPNNDPFAPSPGVPATLTVTPTTNLGRLHGVVSGNRPGGPLAAKVAVEDSTGTTLTLYTVPSNGEYARWLPAGSYTVTASAADYVSQTATVDVQAQSATNLDFELLLDAPGVSTSPQTVSVTIQLGLTNTQQLTVSNTGLRDLSFNIVEENIEDLHLPLNGTQAYAFDFENAAFVRFSLDAPGDWTIINSWPYQHYEGGDFRLNDFSKLYVFWGDYLKTLDTTTGDDTYIASIGIPYPHRIQDMTIAADGTIYAVTDHWYGLPGEPHESYLWTIDPVHGTPTQIGQITNAEFLIGIAINLEGEMYAIDLEQDSLIKIDPATATGTIVGLLGFDLWTGTLEFDDDSGVLYMGTWDYISADSLLWTVDTTSGIPTTIGSFPPGTGIAFLAIVADGRIGAPWLDVAPVSGTVNPGSNMSLDLIFDTTGVIGPDLYSAMLHVVSNDPLIPDLTVPVSMTVSPSPDYGKIDGIIASAGYCDAAPAPLAAEVVVESATGEAWTVGSDPTTGHYYQWVPAGLYTVTVAAENHITSTTSVIVSAGQTSTHDVDLRLYDPCLSLAPETISMTLSSDSLLTMTLTITNSGARDLNWTMRETTETIGTLSIPPFNGVLPPDNQPLSILPLNPSSGSFPRASSSPFSLLYGEPAYALDTGSFNLVHLPDTSDPGNWNVLSNVGRFYSGADFWHGDFSQLYAIDFDTNELVTLDVSTGERTLIGVAYTEPGHLWTGLTAATDGTLYGVSTYCGTESALYTINRQTAETTLIGVTTSATCLIDVAVNAQGEIYAVDIADDVLVKIDPTTGAATSIGQLGINANHAQSLDFEEDTDILYWAAVDVKGHLRRIDVDTGHSIAIGDFPGGAGVDGFAFATGGGDPIWVDVPWVTVVPTTGVTLADGSSQLDVALDTTGLIEDECYQASLGLIHDDPQQAEPFMLPLILCVKEPWPVFYLNKSANTQEVQAGEVATYTIIFGNDGSLETGVTISDVLPSGVTYAWSDPAGVYHETSHEVVWPNLVLDHGARFTNTIVVTVSESMEPGTWFTNTAHLMWRDQVMVSGWASMVVGPDAIFEIFAPFVAQIPYLTLPGPWRITLPP